MDIMNFMDSFYETERDPVTGQPKQPTPAKYLKIAAPDGTLKPLATVKMGLTNSPRQVLEQVIVKYGLDTPAVRSLPMSLDSTATHLGLTGLEWAFGLASMSLLAMASGQPIVVDGKTITLKDDEESAKILQSQFEKSQKNGPAQTFGDYLTNARVLYGEESSSNHMYLQLGLGALCIGGLAYVVHHARK